MDYRICEDFIIALTSDEKVLTVCGTPFGVKMFIDGVLVVDLSEIETENGKICPAKNAGLFKGDVKNLLTEPKFSQTKTFRKRLKTAAEKLWK